MSTPRPPTPIFAGGPLSRRSLRIVRAVAARLFDGGEVISDARLDRFIVDLADWTRYAGPKTRFALRMATVAVQFGPILVVGKPRRFTSLDAATQKRHLEGMDHSSFFTLPFTALKTVLSIIWFDDAEVTELPEQVRKVRGLPIASVAIPEREAAR